MILYMDNKKGERTEVQFPAGTSLGEAFILITSVDGVWENHKQSKAAKPKWVASDSAGLAQLLSEHYDCEVRRVRNDEN